MTKVVATENFSSRSLRNKLLLNANGQLEITSVADRFSSLSQLFQSAFLPQGYPDSVSSDYLQYQVWDTMQAFCSGITHTLATQSLLKGVGVGDDSATVLSATITWLMKDGAGKLGRILFAWIQGCALDCDFKRWRLFADVLFDISIFLGIIAPRFDSYFRIIICISSVCQAIVGVAGGSTRAAITVHQARRDNMADVSAKDGSQETMVLLTALLCSVVVMEAVADNQILIWMLFSLLTALHLFGNYRAVRAVCVETFNQSRFHIVVSDWLLRFNFDKFVVGVAEANRREPVLSRLNRGLRFNIGTSLLNFIRGLFYQLCRSIYSLGLFSNFLLCQPLEVETRSPVDLKFALSLYKGSRYLLVANSRHVNVVLHVDADYSDQLKACYHAEVINLCVYRSSVFTLTTDRRLHDIADAHRIGNWPLMLRLSYQFVCDTFGSLCGDVESVGWMTSPVQLAADEWRTNWDSLTVELLDLTENNPFIIQKTPSTKMTLLPSNRADLNH